MQVIIEHSETKRKINGPFNIWLDKEALEILEDMFRNGDLRPHCWARVSVRQPLIYDTPPSPWDDRALTKTDDIDQ